MENISPTILSRLSVFALITLWVYFYISSYRHRTIFPWGFSVVIIGILVSGIGFRFYNNKVVFFSINLSLAVSLIGVLWNINDIRKQFYVRTIKEFLRYLGIGLILGLLFGLFFMTTQGIKYIQVGSQYTMTALVAISIQASMAEEFLFRGYFLGYLKKYEFNQFFVVVFQALIFAILHTPRYSGDWTAIFITFLTGVTAGYLTWKSNNLISAFVLHIVSNLLAVIWWLAIA